MSDTLTPTQCALESVLKHQISLAQELIFSATLAGRNPYSISFHHIINRLMTILQLQVSFVVLRENNEVLTPVYISNTDSSHRLIIGGYIDKIIKNGKIEISSSSLFNKNKKLEKSIEDVFYPILNTSYRIGVLKCFKDEVAGSHDFEWIYSIKNVEDIKNGWDVAGYKMDRILSYENYEYVGDTFHKAIDKALGYFVEVLNSDNNYSPQAALKKMEESKKDFWRDIYQKNDTLSAQTKEIIIKTKNVFESKLMMDYTTQAYGIVGKSIVDTIYTKSVPNIEQVVGNNNTYKLDNFFLLTRFYEEKDYKRYEGNYDYFLRVAVCKSQRQHFIKYFEKLFDKKFVGLNKLVEDIINNSSPSIIVIVEGVINTIKKITQFEGAAKTSAHTGMPIPDLEAAIDLLIDIINKPLSPYTKSIADGVFKGGVSFFRPPFRQDLALGRSGLNVEQAEKYLSDSLLFKDEFLLSYESFRTYIDKIHTRPEEEQRYFDFFRAFLCRLLFEGMTPPIPETINKKDEYKLSIMMNPIEIGGKVLGVATYLTRSRDPNKEFSSPNDVRYFNKYWLQNYHIAENVNDRIKRVIRMDMERQYIESCADVYKECLQEIAYSDPKVFLIERFYLRLKLLSLFYPYGYFDINMEENIFDAENDLNIPNQLNKYSFFFSRDVSFSLDEPDDTKKFSHSPFSIAIGYWHSKTYNFVERSDIAIALSNQYLNFINMIIIEEPEQE